MRTPGSCSTPASCYGTASPPSRPAALSCSHAGACRAAACPPGPQPCHARMPCHALINMHALSCSHASACRAAVRFSSLGGAQKHRCGIRLVTQRSKHARVWRSHTVVHASLACMHAFIACMPS